LGKKLYVGNIPFKATEEDLKELFSTMGEVVSVKLITDSQTGHMKGFGFVEMGSDEAAKKAMSELNGKSFMERPIVVNEAKERKDSDDRGGYGKGRESYDRKGRR